MYSSGLNILGVELHDSLVQYRCVGVSVFFNDGNNEHDEFGPEVQILNAWTLFLQRKLLLVLNKNQKENS